ncbi:unnamed protein product [Prunus brigantina]
MLNWILKILSAGIMPSIILTRKLIRIGPEFNAATDMADPKFEIGMLFSDCKVFRAAVREYSILQNRDVVFIRNEALKLKAVCGDPDCGWMIYASKMQHDNTLQVKTYQWLSVISNNSWGNQSFKAGCRPIIGLDGCFLKSVYAGQLLTIVGIDANNETWVIAYAVVESECKESWIWFLELLVKDCQIVNQFGFTFIFDKQKGLLPAFEQVVPNCDHRFYARHLFSNYRLLFKAKSLRDKFWEASYATTVPHFTRAMKDLKKLLNDAYEWLTNPDKPPRHWSKSHFNTHLKCDMLLNNLCESFNATILECRDRPILSMFEYIRCKLMRRIQGRRDKMLKWNKPICPRIFKKVEGNKAKAGACVAM